MCEPMCVCVHLCLCSDKREIDSVQLRHKETHRERHLTPTFFKREIESRSYPSRDLWAQLTVALHADHLHFHFISLFFQSRLLHLFHCLFIPFSFPLIHLHHHGSENREEPESRGPVPYVPLLPFVFASFQTTFALPIHLTPFLFLPLLQAKSNIKKKLKRYRTRPYGLESILPVPLLSSPLTF